MYWQIVADVWLVSTYFFSFFLTKLQLLVAKF